MAEISFNIKEAGEGRGSGDLKDIEGFKKLKELVNGKLDHANIASEGIEASNIKKTSLTRAVLAAESKPATWYKPSIIATEQSRENTAFGTLSTPDEVKEVVLPENGLIVIGYIAKVKSSVSSAGRVGIFLGANQLKRANQEAGIEPQEATIGGTSYVTSSTVSTGITAIGGAAADVTTGQILAAGGTGGAGGVAVVFATAGTYNVSVQYRATAGAVTAKERKLWVLTLGY